MQWRSSQAQPALPFGCIYLSHCRHWAAGSCVKVASISRLITGKDVFFTFKTKAWEWLHLNLESNCICVKSIKLHSLNKYYLLLIFHFKASCRWRHCIYFMNINYKAILKLQPIWTFHRNPTFCWLLRWNKQKKTTLGTWPDRCGYARLISNGSLSHIWL